MKKGTILSDILVEKLIFGGKGLAHDPDSKKIIISGGAIPESVVDLRVVKNKKNYLQCQIVAIKKPSPFEAELPDHFQVYGGCRWLPIPYEKQLEIKQNQIHEAFHGFSVIPDSDPESMPKNVLRDDPKLGGVDPELSSGGRLPAEVFKEIVPSPEIYGYRNKLEFSWGKYISKKEGIHEEYRFGFHAPGSFDRIVDCSFCVLGDDQANDLFQRFNTFAQSSGLPTYDQKTQIGFWRHLVIRQAKNRGELMIVLSVNSDFTDAKKFRDTYIVFLEELSKNYEIHSAYLLHNSGKADIVDGEYEHVYGSETIQETLSIGEKSLHFEIAPKSFFQTNTSGAEKLYETARDLISRKGVALDLYAGTGTIGIIVSDLFEKVYSVELVESASRDNKKNLELNNIAHIEVINAKVEDFVSENQGLEVDTIIIDPPRAGMHPSAPENILAFHPSEIIYVSCNPATLVRDLEIFQENYKITDIVPVDMFPHTHHIETVVRMEKK